MKLQLKDRRVDRFLTRYRRSEAFRFDAVEDPRARRGRRWTLKELLDAVLTLQPTLKILGVREFRWVGSSRHHDVQWPRLVRQCTGNPPVVAQYPIGQSQVAPVVQCIGMVRRERIEKLGLQLALHD